MASFIVHRVWELSRWMNGSSVCAEFTLTKYTSMQGSWLMSVYLGNWHTKTKDICLYWNVKDLCQFGETTGCVWVLLTAPSRNRFRYQQNGATQWSGETHLNVWLVINVHISVCWSEKERNQYNCKSVVQRNTHPRSPRLYVFTVCISSHSRTHLFMPYNRRYNLRS